MLTPLLTTLAWLTSLAPQDPPATVTIEVTGIAIDGEQRPVAGVRVTELAGDDHDVAAALAGATDETDRDGRFRVVVTAPRDGDRLLLVGGGRWATMTCPLPTRIDSKLDLGACALAPGSSMAGRVRGADGTPIANATIEASDLLDEQGFLANRDAAGRLSCKTRARSDARGIFRLPGMVQSAGTVRVSCPGYFDEVVKPVGIGTPLDVDLIAAPVWHGRVVADNGEGVADALIRFDYVNAGRTGPDGSFSFSPRDRGADTLRASKRVDGIYLSASADLTKTQSPLQLLLAAPKEKDNRTLRVIAKDAAGAPIAGFKALVAWMPGNQMEYRCDAMLLANKARDAWRGTADGEEVSLSGRIQSSGYDTGLVFVIAEGHGLGRVQIGAAALEGDPVVVTLPKEAVIRGRVLSATSGEPIAGAEVIPTQRISETERRHYEIGFRSVSSLCGAPTSARTDAQGRYELRGVAPGKCDLFVSAPGRIDVMPQMIEVREGETKTDVDLKVPENVTLRGRFEGTVPLGAQVRVHWHRPNMSSSAWANEFDGAVPVAADGTFTLPDLHPKDYEVQLLVAGPPRSGPRLKLPRGIWSGTKADKDVAVFACPPLAPITGKVAGPVPWQRLAVSVAWQERENSFVGGFRLSGPLTMLGPDRSFQVCAPRRSVHVMLLDIVTGVPLEWQEVDASNPVPPMTLAGDAVCVGLELGAADAASARAECQVEFAPEDEQWPYGIGNMVPVRFGAGQKIGCRATWRAGDRVEYWIRTRSGQLQVKRDNQVVQSFDLAGEKDPLRVQVQEKQGNAKER